MTIFLALLALLGAQDLPGAKPRKEKPVVKVLAVKPEKSEVQPGDVVKCVFELEIPKTWHIYPAGKKPLFGNPTVFTFEDADVTGKIEEPTPILKKEEGIGDIDFHEGKITITVPIKVKGPGRAAIRGTVKYQICDPNQCYDGETALTIPLTAGGAAAPPLQSTPEKAKLP